MEVSLDLGSAPSNEVASGRGRRGAVFALHILLKHPEICAAYMEDCEALLRLLGKEAVWLPEVDKKIIDVLKEADDEDSSAIADAGGGGTSIWTVIRGRQAWNTYENVISHMHSKSLK